MTIAEILATFATIAYVDIIVTTSNPPEVLAFGDVAAATVSAILASAAAYVKEVTGNGGFIYNVSGFEIVVYFV